MAPSGLAVLSESCHYLQMAPGSSWRKPGDAHPMSISMLDSQREFYHVRKNNTSFLDGHISSFSKEEFIQKDNHFYLRESASGKMEK